MDLDQMREIVAAIPSGAWMSYGDVACAAGGTDVHARTLNQRFIREEMPGCHRVLKSDGTVGGTALGDPAARGAGARPPPPRARFNGRVIARPPLPPGPLLVVGLARSGVAAALALGWLGAEAAGGDAGDVSPGRRGELER